MTITKLLILSLTTILALNSCGSADDDKSKTTKDKEVTTQVKGKTTLVDATVCVDENRDLVCNEGEIKTISNRKGEYSLTYNGELKEGTTLLSLNGLNKMLLPQKTEYSNTKETASFFKRKTS